MGNVGISGRVIGVFGIKEPIIVVKRQGFGWSAMLWLGFSLLVSEDLSVILFDVPVGIERV